MIISSTEAQNNFGKYIKIAAWQEDVIVTRKGKEIVRMVSCSKGNMVAEEAAKYLTDEKHSVSYKEFLEISENSDLRLELIDGEIYCLASPGFFHQTALAEIYVSFYNWFKGKKCRPLMAPFDITLVKSKINTNVVQPDIVVICDKENLDSQGKYKGVPTLTLEVLSDSTKRNDMIKKLDLYLQTGVKEYWLVDPQKKEVYVYCFEDHNIKSYDAFIDDRIVKSKIFEGLEIALRDIFI